MTDVIGVVSVIHYLRNSGGAPHFNTTKLTLKNLLGGLEYLVAVKIVKYSTLTFNLGLLQLFQVFLLFILKMFCIECELKITPEPERNVFDLVVNFSSGLRFISDIHNIGQQINSMAR